MAKTRISVLPENDNHNGWLHLLGPLPEPRRVQNDERFEFAIIGAGYTGLTAARQLAKYKPDARIALIDAGRIGNNSAGRCSGFAIDQAHNIKSRSFGDDISTGKTQIKLNRAGQGVLREAVEEYAIECDWRDEGKIHGAGTARGATQLHEFSSILDSLDAPYSHLNAEEMHEITGTRFYRAGLDTPGTVQIQPAALVRGIAENMPNNVSVFENSPVTDVHYASLSEQTHRLFCPGGTIEANTLLLANNSFGTAFGFYDKHVMPLPTYASMSRELSAEELAALGGHDAWGIIPADPFGTTVRRLIDNRILVRNIYVYSPGHNPTEKQRLWARRFHERAFRARFPMLEGVELEYSWGGTLCLSRNGNPIFGQLAPGVFASLCHNGVGIARGSVCGKLLADLVSGEESELLTIMLNAGRPNRTLPSLALRIGVPLSLAMRRRRAGGEL